MTEANNNASGPDKLKARFDEIEDEIMRGKHDAESVFTQMRTAALYTAPPAAAVVLPTLTGIYNRDVNALLALITRLNPAPVEQSAMVVPEGWRDLLEMLIESDGRKLKYASDWRKEIHSRAAAMLQAFAAAPTPEPAISQLEKVGYQFQGDDGRWHPFIDQRHYENTLADGSWPIRAIYASSATEQPAKEVLP